jgi:hypothetical protein
MASRGNQRVRLRDDTDVLCQRCGRSWVGIPAAAGPAVLSEHLKVCPVVVSVSDLVAAVAEGTYDDGLEALLAALHTRKRVRRGDVLVALR